MIKQFLDKYYPYKFQVRLKMFTNTSFTIQYSYFRFSPSWNTICTWSEVMKWDSPMLIWNPDSPIEFKSIEDVQKHYEYWEKVEANWNSQQRAIYNRNKRYDGKILN